MNILFLSQVLPYPLDAGPKVRSYYVLRALAEKHRVSLVTFTRAADPPEAIAHLKSFCHAVHPVMLKRTLPQQVWSFGKSMLLNRPFLIVRDDLRQMDRSLETIVRDSEFDAVHADQLSMAHYALRLPVPFRILDQHNAVWKIMERLAENERSLLRRTAIQRDARLLREYEAVTCAKFDRVVTVTQEDRDALTFPNLPTRSPIRVIPICTDPEDSTPVTRRESARDVVCVGGMFYPPNVDGMLWFAHEILPLIWEKSPGTRLHIVGARPDSRLVEMGKADQRIVVAGYVPNPGEYLERAAAFVVPLRAGGGMRVKILDAWMQGVPVVSTTIGAEGITVRSGENILLADAPSQFAHACLQLMGDRNFADRLVRQGREWVTTEYNWRIRYRAWDALYSPLEDGQPESSAS